MANYEENRRQNIDILGNLPREIMQKICLFLTPQDILNIWTHFPQWKWLMNDEYFWQKKCKQVSFYPVGEASKSPCYKKFAEKFGYWQATYFYRETMDYNWENMIYEEIPLENEGPLKKVYHFDDEMLVATTTNNKIKIFNSITGKLEKSFSIVGNGKIIEIKKQDNLLVCVTELYVIAWNLQHDSVLNTWSLGNRINRVIRLLIYQNFVATVVQYSDWGKVNELFILNVNSAIPHSRTPNVGDVLFYDNMAALLVKGSVKVMNTYDNSITNRLCYSADNHRVINIRSQNEYVIGLCEFPDHLHFSVWNMGTSDLVTFLAINFPFQNVNKINYVSFDLLEGNKLAYNYRNSYKATTGINILNYLTGETILSIESPNNLYQYNLGPILKIWNDYLLSMHFRCILGRTSIVYRHTKIFCSRTGRLLRSFGEELPKIDQISDVLMMFTDSKKLTFKPNREEPNQYYSILNFEMNMNRYSC